MSPIDQTSMALWGRVRADAWATGTCIKCEREPDLTTEAGRREYRLSGLCLECFDGIFGDDEDEPASSDDLNRL